MDLRRSLQPSAVISATETAEVTRDDSKRRSRPSRPSQTSSHNAISERFHASLKQETLQGARRFDGTSLPTVGVPGRPAITPRGGTPEAVSSAFQPMTTSTSKRQPAERSPYNYKLVSTSHRRYGCPQTVGAGYGS